MKKTYKKEDFPIGKKVKCISVWDDNDDVAQPRDTFVIVRHPDETVGIVGNNGINYYFYDKEYIDETFCDCFQLTSECCNLCDKLKEYNEILSK